MYDHAILSVHLQLSSPELCSIKILIKSGKRCLDWKLLGKFQFGLSPSLYGV